MVLNNEDKIKCYAIPCGRYPDKIYEELVTQEELKSGFMISKPVRIFESYKEAEREMVLMKIDFLLDELKEVLS